MSYKFLIPIMLCFNTIVFGLELNDNKSISLIESSYNGVTIKFQPALWSIDTLTYQGEEFLKIEFTNASFDGKPGKPVLPLISVPIGVPLDAEISYTILESNSFEISGKVFPQPKVIKKNGITQYKHFVDEAIYSKNEIYPNKLIEISDPAFFRDQRIITIKFYPVRFIPALEKIKLYNTITARIDFIGAKSVVKHFKPPSLEDKLCKDLIINYNQAKYWRKQRVPSLKKYHSIYNNNRWFKISIKDEGIYKITGSMLVDYGIDIKSIDPTTIKIYNNGGRELSRDIAASPPDSLIENAIIVEDGGDDIFDILDYILFYGKSINNWTYNSELKRYTHYINHYEDYNIYWLTWRGINKGKRMQSISAAQDTSISSELSYTNPYHFEQNINNFLNSGYEWFGRLFIPGDKYTFTVNLPQALSNDTFFQFRFLGWASSRHTFTIYVNDKKLDDFSAYGTTYFSKTKLDSGLIQAGYNDITIEYNSNKENSQAYLDWFEIHYQRKFVASDDYLIFYLPPSTGIKKYNITGFTNNDIKIFDITEYHQVKLLINTTISDNRVSFVDNMGSQQPRKMLALTSSAYRTPENIEQVELADLRNPTNGADFIIITHDDFYDAILPLARQREIQDSLKTLVVKISDIYNEFSWGLLDPVAIHDFIKCAYHNWTIAPSFILLCGDGDYDYKNMINKQDKNWIPPYETTDLDENNNRAIDDWFVYVSGTDTYPDVAIGRLPMRSAEETKVIVDKIIAYETAPLLDEDDNYGLDDWRNIVTMVGDDELVEGGTGNETIHTSDAERIMENKNYVPKKFNKKKIYLSEYPAVRGTSILSAITKPTAANAIMNRINRGTLILNYIGHGNPTTWSHEYVLYAPRDFDKIQNGSKLALWIAATCDFGRFDDPSHQSLAEDLLVAKGRGAIAILASTRLAYASNNAALNRSFLFRLFQNQQTSERLGLALLKAKIDNGSGINDQKYVLLGDPAMRLAVPKYKAKITSIEPDSIKALSHITVTGYVEKNNTLWQSFEGKALLKAFDSKKKRKYKTEMGSVLSYDLPGNTIFRGIGSVHQGRFKVSFIVPKDITYGGNYGRISIYFANNSSNGCGYKDSLHVGGTSEIADNQGPDINIGFKNQNFFAEGYTNENPILLVGIADSLSGVNIAGEIGHNISMTIDEEEENKVILTDLFQYNEGSYTEGSILYDFSNYKSNQGNKSGLKVGLHNIKIKAWDNSNNSSTAQAEFIVVSGSQLEISNVLNYPNPFSTSTTFSFWASQDCFVSIKIYTIAGRLLYTLSDFPLAMNELAQIEWDGRDADGDILANGVYFYKVIAKANINGKTETKEVIQKLVIMK